MSNLTVKISRNRINELLKEGVELIGQRERKFYCGLVFELRDGQTNEWHEEIQVYHSHLLESKIPVFTRPGKKTFDTDPGMPLKKMDGVEYGTVNDKKFTKRQDTLSKDKLYEEFDLRSELDDTGDILFTESSLRYISKFKENLYLSGSVVVINDLVNASSKSGGVCWTLKLEAPLYAPKDSPLVENIDDGHDVGFLPKKNRAPYILGLACARNWYEI